jgi:hypothetical protein
MPATAQGGLGDDEDAALGQTIGDGAGHDGEEQHRRELQGADEPEPER